MNKRKRLIHIKRANFVRLMASQFTPFKYSVRSLNEWYTHYAKTPLQVANIVAGMKNSKLNKVWFKIMHFNDNKLIKNPYGNIFICKFPLIAQVCNKDISILHKKYLSYMNIV